MVAEPDRNATLIINGRGTPLAEILSGGHRNDVTQHPPLTDAVPPVRGRIARLRRKPNSYFSDRGYDHYTNRHQVRQRCTVPAFARRGTLHDTG
ncbi:transposase [Streptomyces cyaneofuscatus]|uniref:transposase n=1 Tax=Streptomyces cyaneofuscatus TaxID=66883 RepID=UPI00380CEFE4